MRSLDDRHRGPIPGLGQWEHLPSLLLLRVEAHEARIQCVDQTPELRGAIDVLEHTLVGSCAEHTQALDGDGERGGVVADQVVAPRELAGIADVGQELQITDRSAVHERTDADEPEAFDGRFDLRGQPALLLVESFSRGENLCDLAFCRSEFADEFDPTVGDLVEVGTNFITGRDVTAKIISGLRGCGERRPAQEREKAREERREDRRPTEAADGNGFSHELIPLDGERPRTRGPKDPPPIGPTRLARFCPDEKAGAGTLTTMPGYDAVLLLSFGGPEGPDDVVPFLENVTAGRGIPHERLVEVGAHYAHFDGISPINEQCRRIRTALAETLTGRGHELPVYWGNRNWHPFLADTVREIVANGHERVLAVVTSAYSSYSACRQYLDDVERARADVGDTAPIIDKVGAYYDRPGFIEPFVQATTEALASFDDDAEPTLVFTAHSIPTSMASTCDYEVQLDEAARLISERVGAEPLPWRLAWQSRSGPPVVPWLEPDVNDELRALAAEGVDAAAIVPIGFVSDHIEVLWDLDVEAAATAAELGIELRRVSTPGTAPQQPFIDMLADLVEERIDDVSPADRATLGSHAPRPDRCAVDCCPPPRRPGAAID